MRKGGILLITGTLVLSCLVFATTWGEHQMMCPVCRTKNTFYAVMSYGGYIYSWPSKFQYVFWPATDRNVVYTCKKCHLSLFMWDYEQIPADKKDQIEQLLKGTTISGDYPRYNEIPMSQRLAIAERIYAALHDQADLDFWCWFYRVKGYHLAREKKTAEAESARKKASELVLQMLADPRNDGKRKELLLISGAMRHFLANDKGAERDFTAALQLTFTDPKLRKDQNANTNSNLDNLLKEYLEALKTNRVPADDGSER